ncbi:alpha-amylase family glycosyl hydrolase [Erythrobacter sp. BLCC-B19]|uniref:alpha-amylase family glycosyl hydrolase n=1 Tax=Erythrobacter sp. BLCC-B19 TaxID=3025315 RepID=UPI00235F2FB7|nr:alpha-amylase family glycosyl hydrolase [Erythrobacter sp. BLCC-B19]WDA41286.1 alpha-amylase family glycosyl hydrolase [Erythrobacter sp. BLCC-B19]
MNRLACALAALTLALPAAAQPPVPADVLEGEVVYHVFQRSFRDSNGDGHGDLEGVRQSLPYLRSLGVTAVLMTPLYPSRVYHNYFATDFEGIDPRYGTREDLQKLIADAHARGMKIYLDMEFQYLAEGHPWWTAALADRNSPYADWMLWDDRAAGIAEEGPFGLREIAHFGRDTHGVTTVALKHPEVRAWFDRYLMGWVDPDGDGRFDDGVDGFRLDHMMDDLDDKGLLTDLFRDFWNPAFAKLRAARPDLAFIAEQSDWQYGEDYLARSDVSAVFAFPIHDAIRKFDKAALAQAMRRTAAITPAGKTQLLFAENHDVSRIASDPGITPEKLRTAAALMFLLRGTPILYYGQELGMRGAMDAGYPTDENHIPVREAFKWASTDAAPGQALWYRRPGERYWDQRYARDHDGVSVEEQDGKQGSLLEHYRRLAALRQAHPALVSGAQRVLESPAGLLAVERSGGGERLVILANLTPARFTPPAALAQGTVLLGGPGGALRAWQTAVYRLP